MSRCRRTFIVWCSNHGRSMNIKVETSTSMVWSIFNSIWLQARTSKRVSRLRFTQSHISVRCLGSRWPAAYELYEIETRLRFARTDTDTVRRCSGIKRKGLVDLSTRIAIIRQAGLYSSVLGSFAPRWDHFNKQFQDLHVLFWAVSLFRNILHPLTDVILSCKQCLRCG